MIKLKNTRKTLCTRQQFQHSAKDLAFESFDVNFKSDIRAGAGILLLKKSINYEGIYFNLLEYFRTIAFEFGRALFNYSYCR